MNELDERLGRYQAFKISFLGSSEESDAARIE
jgi:hypothetical protein